MLEDRKPLRAAGTLREQAAFSLLRRGMLPQNVVADARRALLSDAYAAAQRAYDSARRTGDNATANAARRERDAALTREPDDIALARHLARMLPSRPRGGADDRMRAARAVEAEIRRLQRLDRFLNRAEAEAVELAADVAVAGASALGQLLVRAAAGVVARVLDYAPAAAALPQTRKP